MNNLSINIRKNHIELQWNAQSGGSYKIIRYTGSSNEASQIISAIINLNSENNQTIFKDNRSLKRGTTYHYSIFGLDSPFRSQKSIKFYSPAPMPVTDIKTVVLSNQEIAISWESYKDTTDIARYDLYVENQMFKNISEKTIKSSTKQKSITYTLSHPEKNLFIAIVPVGPDEKKILTVNPVIIKDPWKSIISKDLSVVFFISPIAQNKNQLLTIDLSNGSPISSYNIIIDSTLVNEKILTDDNGHGKTTFLIPDSIGPGRHSITLDDGLGSFISSEHIFLVPIRLSPITDVINLNTDHFDTTIVDRVKFENENVTFRFKRDTSPEALNLHKCSLLTHFNSGAITTNTVLNKANLNIPVNILPSFTYPPFIYTDAGSLNLFGLVQATQFQTALDWANHINEFHEYFDGNPRVVKSIVEFDANIQKFTKALIDTGFGFHGDYDLTPGLSYMIEVRDPVTNYSISANGLMSMDYTLKATPFSSLNYIVLVANGTFPDAESWASEINDQHELATGFSRVVLSISAWSASDQNYGVALIDAGFRYEGNFILTHGQGYIIEVKETVSNLMLTGDALTNNPC